MPDDNHRVAIVDEGRLVSDRLEAQANVVSLDVAHQRIRDLQATIALLEPLHGKARDLHDRLRALELAQRPPLGLGHLAKLIALALSGKRPDRRDWRDELR